MTWRFSPAPPPPPPPPEVLPPGGARIATTPQNFVAYDGQELHFDGNLEVGYFANGYPFFIPAAGVNLVRTVPPSVVYDQPSGTTLGNGTESNGSVIDPPAAWVNGMEYNSGNAVFALGTSNISNERGVLWGLDSRRLTESPSMNPSPAYGYSGPADGVNGTPYPAGHVLAGEYRNNDPGFLGRSIPTIHPRWGNQYSITKATHRPNYTFRDRLQVVQVFTALPEAPLEGAVRPGPAGTTKPIPVYRSDFDLTGLPTVATPSGAASASAVLFSTSKPFIHTVTGSDGQRNQRGRWEAVPYDPAVSGSGGNRRVPEFGRDIGWQFSAAALNLLFDNGSPAQKQQLADNIIQCGIDLVDRVDQGGSFYPVDTPGAHVQQWGPIVAICAFLTRNSPRQAYFDRYLRLDTVSAFQGGLGQGKVVELADLSRRFNVLTNQEWMNRSDYKTLALRPPALGTVMGDANRAQGYCRWGIGRTAYYHQHFNSIVGMALFLKLVGGEEFSPRAEWWNLMEQYADVLRWHDGADFADEEGFRAGHRSTTATESVKALWQFAAAPVSRAPALTAGMSLTVRREMTSGVYQNVDENWVWARFAGMIQRRLSAQLPPAAAFTVTVAGVPRAVDVSQAGHVAVRAENVGVALVGPALVPGTACTLTYNPGMAVGRELRFHDGTLVPGFTDLPCPIYT